MWSFWKETTRGTTTTSRRTRPVYGAFRIVPFLSFLLGSHPTNVQSFVEHKTNNKTNDPNNICTVFLAPSTIPGAGLGIFTSIDRKNGTIIGESDVIIPIVDLDWHQGDRSHFFWIFSEYVWDGKEMNGMHRETDQEVIDAYAPGLDCAINCHLGLINVDRTAPLYDGGTIASASTTSSALSQFPSPMLPHRTQHAAAGSMTPYYKSDTIATHDIPAGAELFKYYGDQWFETRPTSFGTIPLTNDYIKAMALLRTYSKVVAQQLTHTQDHEEQHGKQAPLRNDVKRDLYQIMITSIPSSRTLNALPRRYEDVQDALNLGLRALEQRNHIRHNVSVMPEARCLEYIYHQKSTLPGAGRGAFVKRSFQAGDVITGSPLLHVPDKELMNYYNTDGYENEYDDNNTNSNTTSSDEGNQKSRFVVGQQLLINYCWGHDESTLLLCPYGSGVNFINHYQQYPDHDHPFNKTNQSDTSSSSFQPNVKIRWAPMGHLGQDDAWFDLSPKEMVGIYQPHLAWDYVALRDIAKGEELFLDYGKPWVRAWENHASHWKPPFSKDIKNYKSAAEWNEIWKDSILRTDYEQERNPYPKNLELVCHRAVASNVHQSIQEHYDKSNINQIWTIGMDGVPCRIARRSSTTTSSTRNHNNHHPGNDPIDPNKHYNYQVHVKTVYGWASRTNVEREMFRFRDRTYSTDIHLPGVFRQPTTIPDGMMPSQWQNRKSDVVPAKEEQQEVQRQQDDEL